MAFFVCEHVYKFFKYSRIKIDFKIRYLFLACLLTGAMINKLLPILVKITQIIRNMVGFLVVDGIDKGN